MLRPLPDGAKQPGATERSPLLQYTEAKDGAAASSSLTSDASLSTSLPEAVLKVANDVPGPLSADCEVCTGRLNSCTDPAISALCPTCNSLRVTWRTSSERWCSFGFLSPGDRYTNIWYCGRCNCGRLGLQKSTEANRHASPYFLCCRHCGNMRDRLTGLRRYLSAAEHERLKLSQAQGPETAHVVQFKELSAADQLKVCGTAIYQTVAVGLATASPPKYGLQNVLLVAAQFVAYVFSMATWRGAINNHNFRQDTIVGVIPRHVSPWHFWHVVWLLIFAGVRCALLATEGLKDPQDFNEATRDHLGKRLLWVGIEYIMIELLFAFHSWSTKDKYSFQSKVKIRRCKRFITILAIDLASVIDVYFLFHGEDNNPGPLPHLTELRYLNFAFFTCSAVVFFLDFCCKARRRVQKVVSVFCFLLFVIASYALYLRARSNAAHVWGERQFYLFFGVDCLELVAVFVMAFYAVFRALKPDRINRVHSLIRAPARPPGLVDLILVSAAAAQVAARRDQNKQEYVKVSSVKRQLQCADDIQPLEQHVGEVDDSENSAILAGFPGPFVCGEDFNRLRANLLDMNVRLRDELNHSYVNCVAPGWFRDLVNRCLNDEFI